MSLITEEIRALIGAESAPRVAATPISEDMLRRFNHGVMEENPVHWDAEVAVKSRYAEVVAPPLFPLHAFRRAPGAEDPFAKLTDKPDDDGTFGGGSGFGLPPVSLPLTRRLNGGTEAEFFKLARIGDVITARSKYIDITERAGRDGSPMVITRIATTYTNQDDDVLAVITISMISR